LSFLDCLDDFSFMFMVRFVEGFCELAPNTNRRPAFGSFLGYEIVELDLSLIDAWSVDHSRSNLQSV
jgi:hypothetical protein